MKRASFDTSFELKFLAETGVFEGYASVFNVTDSANDKIVPGAFKESLEIFRQEKRLPPLLWQHDTAEPIGAWREMYEDAHGLFVKGELFVSDIALAKEAYKLLKENVVTGLSIGYRTKQSHRDEKCGVRVLTQLDLLEVSLVTFPANAEARVTGVKRFFGGGNAPSEREFEAFLREAGLSRKQAKGVISQGYKALAAKDLAPDEEAIRLLRESIQRATQELRADLYSTKSCLALRSSLQVVTAELRAKANFSPSQPRVPSGITTYRH